MPTLVMRTNASPAVNDATDGTARCSWSQPPAPVARIAVIMAGVAVAALDDLAGAVDVDVLDDDASE